jgi:hypothetical protein
MDEVSQAQRRAIIIAVACGAFSELRIAHDDGILRSVIVRCTAAIVTGEIFLESTGSLRKDIV